MAEGSLPYIDSAYNNDITRDLVHSLIEEEMEKGSFQEYLAAVPDHTVSFGGSELLMHEWRRIEQGIPQQEIDFVGRSVADMDDSTFQGRDAIDRAQTRLEGTANALINAELMKKYGSESWKYYSQLLVDMKEKLEQDNENAEEALVELQALRKRSQLKVGGTLEQLQQQYMHLVGQNAQLRQRLGSDTDTSGEP
jgi:hypothetical protein